VQEIDERNLARVIGSAVLMQPEIVAIVTRGDLRFYSAEGKRVVTQLCQRGVQLFLQSPEKVAFKSS
jgi:hypothetical protein